MHNKVITGSFIFFVILILAGGYFSYYVQKEAILESRYDKLTAIRDLKSKQIVDWRNERIDDARVFLHNQIIVSEIKEFVESKSKVKEESLLDWFRQLRATYDYKRIVLTDKNFDPILSTEPNLKISLDSLHIKNYKMLNDSEDVILSPIQLGNDGKPYFAIRINYTSEGEIYARLIVSIDPAVFLYPLIQNWPTISKTAETLLVKQEGDSILFLNELRHQSDTALRLKLPKNKSNLPAALAVSGHEGFYRGVDYRGKKVLSSVSSIPQTDWYIISKIDEDEIFGELQSALINSVVIVILLILISYLIFLFVLRNMRLKSLNTELILQEEKIRLNNLYATLSQINQAIVRESNRAELILKITQLPVTFGDFNSCALNLFDEDSKKLKVESFYGDFNYFHKILDNDSSYKIKDPGYYSYDKKLTIVVNDLSSSEETWSSIAQADGINSCAAANIVVFGKTIGAFVLYSDKIGYFNEPEIKLLEEITSDVAFSLEVMKKNEIRKEMETQIIENERRLATLFSNLPGIAYRCKLDKDWTMLFMSNAAYDITGYKPDEIIHGKVISYNDLIFEEDREYVWNQVAFAVEHQRDFALNYRIKPKNSEELKWVWEQGSVIRNNSENEIFLEGFINDITETKKVEKELIKAKEEAERANNVKTAFLAQMSHEIRTPVNVILSFNSLIKDSVLDKIDNELIDGFGSIESASQRLIRTIDSILNMAQITSGVFEVSLEKIALYDQVIRPIKNEFEPIATNKGLTVTLTNNCDNSLVYGDLYTLTQMFSNLVDNAVKYTIDGSVDIKLDCDDDYVTAKISDTGVGISKEYLPNLFSAFSQEEIGYSRRFEGTGLGLALVKNYCEMNYAEIEVESTKGIGTVFTVKIPKVK